MSKPVYKRLSETYANLASLYIGLANDHAEAAKVDPPFPLHAIEQEPAPDLTATNINSPVPTHAEVVTAASAPVVVVPADPPEVDEVKAEAEAALPLEDDVGEPIPTPVNGEAVAMSAEETEERVEATKVLLAVGNAVGFSFVHQTLKPFYSVDDPMVDDLEKVREMITHAKVQLAEKVGIIL